MNLYTTQGAITITCHKRIMPYLAAEVKELSFNVEESFVTGVRLRGSINDCIKLNLNLRCASQVLYSLKQFRPAMPTRSIATWLNTLGKYYSWRKVIFPSPAM